MKGNGGDYELIRVPSGGATCVIDISNITFDGNKSGLFTGDNYNTGLHIYKSTSSVNIHHCTFQYFDFDGITLGYNNAVTANTVKIHSNYFHHIGRTGIAVISVNSLIIEKNMFDAIDHQAIDVESDVNSYYAAFGIIDGNIIKNSGNTTYPIARAAISVNHIPLPRAAENVSGEIIVTKNEIYSFGSATTVADNYAHGISMNYGNNNIIDGNIVNGVKNKGIFVQGTTNVNIVNNVSTGNGIGIEIGGSTSDILPEPHCEGNKGVFRVKSLSVHFALFCAMVAPWFALSA